MELIPKILNTLGCRVRLLTAGAFCAEEDGRAYHVWKLETDRGTMVLKKTTPGEIAVYDVFFNEGGPVPRVYGSGVYEGEMYLLMEFVAGESMSRCTRDRLILMLDAMIASQQKWWNCTDHGQIGYGFQKCWPDRCKRLEYMGELKEAYRAYLEEFARVPRTLCNDDLLPFNVLADEHRAVMLDWEYAGILPYPCALARFLAFGEEEGELFCMTREDRQFALDYYYENLIRSHGISREEFDRTMMLFFLKEYSEWVYCAALSGDFEMEYYKKYGKKAVILAEMLGLLKEKGENRCCV